MSEAKTPPCKLYLITPPQIDPHAFAEDLKAALDAAPGVVGAVQLRLKDVPDEDIITAANVLLPICHAADVPLIINDRADIAQATGADGVHLGQDDTSLADARALLGADAVIGVTMPVAIWRLKPVIAVRTTSPSEPFFRPRPKMQNTRQSPISLSGGRR